MKLEDLNTFFNQTFSDCYQAANYVRALNGLRTVQLDSEMDIFGSKNKINLINWYLNKINYEWVDFAICVIDKHIVTLATIDGEKCLLGVDEIKGQLKGAMYNRHLLHYPIYWIKRTDVYDHEKLKNQYAIR